jgi:hypothetical protein
MHRCPPKLEIYLSWRILTSWIVESSEVKRLLHLLPPKEEQWEWVQVLGEVNRPQMVMQASEMGIIMDIVNKMVDATLLTADIAMVCLLHLLKMSVDEHGNDTGMTDQTLDYPRDHRQ